MKYFSLLTVLLGLSISGCGEYLTRDFMSGPTPCLPKEQAKVIRHNNNFHFVEAGQTREHLLTNGMGNPDSYEVKYVNGDEPVEVFFYQASSKTCQWASRKDYEFEPVIVKDGIVVGKGHTYYKDNTNSSVFHQILAFTSFQ